MAPISGNGGTPWIVGGMAVLAVGGISAAFSTTLIPSHFALGIVMATISFAMIGCGVSAAGTSLLVLMAKRVGEERRAAAATVVWMMMIAGFAITATVRGQAARSVSPRGRLLAVAGGVSGIALTVTVLALWGLEGRPVPALDEAPDEPTEKVSFMTAARQVWAEPDARRFTIFVFISMLAYSAQDLILEPFAGAIFAFSPGASTKLSGTQHAGVFAGMLLVAILTTLFKGTPIASLKGWVVGGCVASGLAMVGLAIGGIHGAPWPVRENVFLLGLANGVFSIAAIGSMMLLASQGRRAREGMRMGLWGAAQAIAFGIGGLLGTVLADAAKYVVGPTGSAYAFVFRARGDRVFFVAQWVALRTTFDEKVTSVGDAETTPTMPERTM